MPASALSHPYLVGSASKRHAAVDQMGLPGNVARLVRGKKDRERRHLLGPAEAPHGLALDESLLDLLERLSRRLRAVLDAALERGRLDGARTDRVRPDALPDKVG